MVHDQQVPEAAHPVAENHLAARHGMHRPPFGGADEQSLGRRSRGIAWSAEAPRKFPLNRQSEFSAQRGKCAVGSVRSGEPRAAPGRCEGPGQSLDESRET